MTFAGGNPKGGAKRYYCANAREKGPAVCVGQRGVLMTEVEELVLSSIRGQLMHPEAYGKFTASFAAHQSATAADRAADLRLLDKRIDEQAGKKEGILKAIESGVHSPVLIERLNELDRILKEMRAQREEATPAKVELPPELPQIWQAMVTDLVASLSEESVVGPAGDELREVIDAIEVRWDPAAERHGISIIGKLWEMLEKSAPALAALGPFAAVALSSFQLVAGAGFEPATFRL
nr:hypothetical protein [Mangrovicoccus sp. HB161399]